MEEIMKFIKNGKIMQIPRKWESKEKLFLYVSTFFEEGKEYTEREVNEILMDHYSDYAILRRYLVDFKFLERSVDGKLYKRLVG
ncbi:MAG: DUF2087 domain-containing protein [Lachnospiraceae bacterium]|nr:DUF2087 domain-containing protein [Lachnospiraceae bacterium]